MKKVRSDHFLVTRTALPLKGLKPSRAVPGDAAATEQGAELQFAVPKKLLKRAVDRNAVRRVGKESWRSLITRAGGSTRQAIGQYQVRIRLLNRPKQFADLSRPARKRFWRSELDQILSKILL